MEHEETLPDIRANLTQNILQDLLDEFDLIFTRQVFLENDNRNVSVDNAHVREDNYFEEIFLNYIYPYAIKEAKIENTKINWKKNGF